jgi:uncharacterized spore protein YtfJ
MKKALVVFLILAVAGGLFAEVTFGGHAETGYGYGWDDTDADGTVGLIRGRGENGLRIGFTLSGKVVTENYGTFSGSLGLRHQVDRFGGADGNAYYLNFFEDPRLTWTTGNSIGLILGIGTGGPGGTGTMGDFDTNLDAGGGNGLAAQIKPIAGLTVAASAIFGRAQTTLDKIVYAAGVKYSATDLLDVAANVAYNQAAADDKEKLNAAFGVSILPIVKALGFSALAFDARTFDGIGGSKSYIGVGERIGFNAGDLSLLLRARQLFWGGDDDGAHDFIPMKFNLEVGYKVSDLIKVGIDGRYIIGNAPAFNFRNAGEINDAGWNKDKVGLGVSPYVAFSVGGPTITLGYNLQKDMSDPAPASGTRSLQHLIYGQIHASF